MSFTFDADKHEYRLDGNVLPSVTQILEPISPDFSMVKESVMENKIWIGVNTHRAIELYNKKTLDIKSLPDEIKGYFGAYLKFRKEHDYKSLMSEARMYHKVLRYAGTMDDYGILNGHHSVVDTKCVAQLSPSYGPQGAAYAELLKHNGYPVKRRFVLLLKPDETYQLKRYRDRNDIVIFNSALNLLNWRTNNGLNKHAA